MTEKTDTPKAADFGAEFSPHLYAAHAPRQTLRLRGRSQTPGVASDVVRAIDLVPAKIAQVPAEHPVIEGMIETGLLKPEDNAEASDTGTLSEGPDPATLPPMDPARITAISAVLGSIGDEGRTESGSAKVSAVSAAVGFDVTAAERDAAELEG